MTLGAHPAPPTAPANDRRRQQETAIMLEVPDTVERQADGPRQTFLDEVRRAIPGDSRLETCIQCGTCGGSCPSAADMDHSPRQIFALIRAGGRDRVLSSNTPWMCVSCYLCAVRCPQDIHIPDVMYALKAMSTRDRRTPGRTAPDFSRTFITNIHRYGRSFEVGLVARHYLRHYVTRLPGMAPAGVGMLAKGRMGLRPHRIRGAAGLRAILARAKDLEAARASAGSGGTRG
jgi:quinone-modifying oxidoreductase, subunit QmoC